ncbi:hypothetical protein ACRAWF_38330 [Streptomyces sp. L7]
MKVVAPAGSGRPARPAAGSTRTGVDGVDASYSSSVWAWLHPVQASTEGSQGAALPSRQHQQGQAAPRPHPAVVALT